MKNVIQTVEIARTAMNITWCDFQQISGNKLAVIINCHQHDTIQTKTNSFSPSVLIYAPFENTA